MVEFGTTLQAGVVGGVGELGETGTIYETAVVRYCDGTNPLRIAKWLGTISLQTVAVVVRITGFDICCVQSGRVSSGTKVCTGCETEKADHNQGQRRLNMFPKKDSRPLMTNFLVKVYQKVVRYATCSGFARAQDLGTFVSTKACEHISRDGAR